MEPIKMYVDAIFSSLPKTSQIDKIKMNMLFNLEEKFNELVASGKKEEEAVGLIIGAIGSSEELKKELALNEEIEGISGETKNPGYTFDKDYSETYTNNKADWELELEREFRDFKPKQGIATAISVGLFILSPIAFLFADEMGFHSDLFPMLTMFLMIAVGVGILIYFDHLEKRYEGLEISKDFKKAHTKEPQRNVYYGNKVESQHGYGSFLIDKRLRGLLSSLLWSGIVLFYLFIGFFFGLWHPGWMIFILGSAIEILITYITRIDE